MTLRQGETADVVRAITLHEIPRRQSTDTYVDRKGKKKNNDQYHSAFYLETFRSNIISNIITITVVMKRIVTIVYLLRNKISTRIPPRSKYARTQSSKVNAFFFSQTMFFQLKCVSIARQSEWVIFNRHFRVFFFFLGHFYPFSTIRKKNHEVVIDNLLYILLKRHLSSLRLKTLLRKKKNALLSSNIICIRSIINLITSFLADRSIYFYCFRIFCAKSFFLKF